jgi:hypothetical protein
MATIEDKERDFNPAAPRAVGRGQWSALAARGRDDPIPVCHCD